LRYDHYLGFFSCRGSAITNNAHRTYFLESDLFPIHADIQGEQWFGDSQKAICLGLGLKWEPVKFAAQRFDLPEGFAHGCKIVVCQPHSLIPSKNWPEDSWIKMLTLLGQRRDDLAFLFVGSPAEAETSERVKAALAGYRVLNACDTNLSEMTGLLQKADLFIGTDSGPGHIASAVGVKSLLLYGPTKPETYRPEGFGGTALWAGASCAPCGLFTCLLSEAPKCECMDLITPLEAANAAEKLLL
jgi:ADP-heptose:LPS heptosyltransferase